MQNRGSASGFDTAVDQECENLICTHPGNNATCVSEGRAAATVVAQTANLTCEQCITKFLTPQHIQRLFGILDDFPHTLENLCPVLHGIATEQEFRQLLDDIGFSQPGLQDRLLSCLSKAVLYSLSFDGKLLRKTIYLYIYALNVHISNLLF
jgi:hypothetical protein